MIIRQRRFSGSSPARSPIRAVSYERKRITSHPQAAGQICAGSRNLSWRQASGFRRPGVSVDALAVWAEHGGVAMPPGHVPCHESCRQSARSPWCALEPGLADRHETPAPRFRCVTITSS